MAGWADTFDLLADHGQSQWTHFYKRVLSAQYVPDAGLQGEDAESVQQERQACNVPSTPSNDWWLQGSDSPGQRPLWSGRLLARTLNQLMLTYHQLGEGGQDVM